MTRAVVGFCLLLAAYRVGVWVGRTDERHSRPVALCPKVEMRWVGTGQRRRLDTITVIPGGVPMSGKGSTSRPKSVTEAEFADNFARTFSRQVDDATGYDPRPHYCPPLEDSRDRMRRDNTAHAERVILSQPPAPWLPCTHDWPYRDQLPSHDPED